MENRPRKPSDDSNRLTPSVFVLLLALVLSGCTQYEARITSQASGVTAAPSALPTAAASIFATAGPTPKPTAAPTPTPTPVPTVPPLGDLAAKAEPVVRAYFNSSEKMQPITDTLWAMSQRGSVVDFDLFFRTAKTHWAPDDHLEQIMGTGGSANFASVLKEGGTKTTFVAKCYGQKYEMELIVYDSLGPSSPDRRDIPQKAIQALIGFCPPSAAPEAVRSPEPTATAPPSDGNLTLPQAALRIAAPARAFFNVTQAPYEAAQDDWFLGQNSGGYEMQLNVRLSHTRFTDLDSARPVIGENGTVNNASIVSSPRNEGPGGSQDAYRFDGKAKCYGQKYEFQLYVLDFNQNTTTHEFRTDLGSTAFAKLIDACPP